MDPESKKLLENTVRLAEENNQMLRSLMRSMRITRIISFLYWIFIIGSAVGAYYLIQPYLQSLLDVYGNVGDVLNSFQQ